MKLQLPKHSRLQNFMTMAAPSDDTKPKEDSPRPPQERERGTLKDTLPRRPIILIALTCIVSAALATALFVYSYSSPLTVHDVAKLAFVACLGAVSCATGIVFGDSLAHIFAFGVAVS